MHAATLGARGGGSYAASNPATYPGISLQGTPPVPSPLVCGLWPPRVVSWFLFGLPVLSLWCAGGWQ